MKASINWIRELLPALKAPASAIEQRLTSAGIEVEGRHAEAEALEGLIVGELRNLAPHPDADRLRIGTIFDGERERPIVTGAENAENGQKLVFAPPGTTLPNGMKIEARAIRGAPSEGMLCSAAELGFEEKSAGLLVLNSRAKPGKPVAPLLERTDVILELGIPPNRPDLLSHFGLARELAALFRLAPPELKVKVKESSPPAAEFAKIDLSAGARCPRYVGRVIRGVKVGPSPDWVKKRLESIGVRSISNVVDATNLALMELGHPLHAFDLEKLSGQRVRARLAKPGEKLKTLDGVERALHEDDLVIADGVDPVALAGVMGGATSEVSDTTTNVLLEAAWFEPRGVRRTAKRHGLHTEASHRFERGTDPAAIERAIDRTAELILEMAGGKLAAGRIDAARKEAALAPRIVGIRPSRAAALIGRPVDKDEVRATLGALGLGKAAKPAPKKAKLAAKKGAKKNAEASDALYFSVPSWRIDLVAEEDLIEEVARYAGYDAIPAVMPPTAAHVWTTAPRSDPAARLREVLTAEGYDEAISLAFNSPAQQALFGGDFGQAVVVANPLGEESARMRQSLLPALLRAAQFNQAHSRTDLRLFEIGTTFAWSDPPGRLPEEVLRVALVLRGRRNPEGWSQSKDLADAYDLKAAVEGLLAAYNVRGELWRPHAASYLHPRSAARIEVPGIGALGVLGELHPKVAQAFELEGPPLYVAELAVDRLLKAAGPRPIFRPLPRFPVVARDLSFFVDRAKESSEILALVRDVAGPSLSDVRIFDVYEGQGVPEGKRSVAIAMTFRHDERTLTDAEVDAGQQGIIAALEGRLGAHVRRA